MKCLAVLCVLITMLTTVANAQQQLAGSSDDLVWVSDSFDGGVVQFIGTTSDSIDTPIIKSFEYAPFGCGESPVESPIKNLYLRTRTDYIDVSLRSYINKTFYSDLITVRKKVIEWEKVVKDNNIRSLRKRICSIDVEIGSSVALVTHRAESKMHIEFFVVNGKIHIIFEIENRVAIYSYFWMVSHKLLQIDREVYETLTKEEVRSLVFSKYPAEVLFRYPPPVFDIRSFNRLVESMSPDSIATKLPDYYKKWQEKREKERKKEEEIRKKNEDKSGLFK